MVNLVDVIVGVRGVLELVRAAMLVFSRVCISDGAVLLVPPKPYLGFQRVPEGTRGQAKWCWGHGPAPEG